MRFEAVRLHFVDEVKSPLFVRAGSEELALRLPNSSAINLLLHHSAPLLSFARAEVLVLKILNDATKLQQ